MPGITHDQLKAYKSLGGYNFYVNGKVSNLVVTEVPGTKNYLFTVVVKHSQALSIPSLNFFVWIAVKDTGEVICGHCSCMAGVGEACAHVGSVLFVAEVNTNKTADVIHIITICIVALQWRNNWQIHSSDKESM